MLYCLPSPSARQINDVEIAVELKTCHSRTSTLMPWNISLAEYSGSIGDGCWPVSQEITTKSIANAHHEERLTHRELLHATLDDARLERDDAGHLDGAAKGYLRDIAR
jgi:hypothetical protein